MNINQPSNGNVVGPASATDNHLAVFDGTTGKLIKDGGAVPAAVTPGGSTTQLQYNNAGTFGGISGATTDGTVLTLVAPVLGAASATSINKVAITTPASSATLTIANGKTLTASNSLTLVGADGTTMMFPPFSASVGYLNIPSQSKSADYTAVLADSGYSIDHPATDNNARTWTIPANGSVAYPVGTCLSFSNMDTNALTIAITTDTLYLAGAGTTGSRSLAQFGTATARKLTSTTWLISGVNLT